MAAEIREPRAANKCVDLLARASLDLDSFEALEIHSPYVELEAMLAYDAFGDCFPPCDV